MPNDQTLSWVESHPAAARRLLSLAVTASNQSEFWPQALAIGIAAVPARSAAIARSEAGKWSTIATTGPTANFPSELLSEALDRDRAVRSGTWIAAPVSSREVLAVGSPDNRDAGAEAAVAALADIFRSSIASLREREQCRSRAQRLEAVLAIAGQWNQTLELDQLLSRMAEASTRLLDAERASIFLWDRLTKMLVGRPALGVAGGELRIPDNQGVVGQVIQTGQPRRVGVSDERHEIDHSLDQKLQFRTRSLLCVPLFGSDGHVLGAFELLNKRHGDFTADDEAGLVELASHAAIALTNSRQHEQLLRSRNQVAAQAAARVQWIGECTAMQQLRQSVERVANTDLAVLVLGENGTGKEVVAQLIHYHSRRRHEPFVAVNCAALPDSLLESELFGHEKGAFTDARETRQGKFELASGGTLLLDEIGDMSLSGQAKLLRVIEEKVVVRVGGSLPIHTDSRIIAATNHNLAELVQEKKFRQDLYFRLTVVTLNLPPLRDRGDDVLLLAEHFLREFAIKAKRPPPVLTAAAKKRLLGHPWPGNVRELRNLMERLAYLSVSDKIDSDELSFIMSPSVARPSLLDSDESLADATREFQIAYIQSHIDRARGNMTGAAERLGLHRSNLYRKMSQLGMKVTEE
jgi:transcriptional regulator with GAF, ATPase, and Fis domain